VTGTHSAHMARITAPPGPGARPGQRQCVECPKQLDAQRRSGSARLHYSRVRAPEIKTPRRFGARRPCEAAPCVHPKNSVQKWMRLCSDARESNIPPHDGQS
jgi:hypothetical protein